VSRAPGWLAALGRAWLDTAVRRSGLLWPDGGPEDAEMSAHIDREGVSP
jgi:hypothetical protein